MYRACGSFSVVLMVLTLGTAVGAADGWAEPAAEQTASPEGTGAAISWPTDYGQAVRDAMADGKMVFVLFYRPAEKVLGDYFQSEVLGDPAVAEKLREHVCVRLPLDVKIRLGGREVGLLEHTAFRRMHGREGVAIVDFAHRDASYYGHVVSALPFTEDHCYSAGQMLIVLGLPPGTDAQRTRVFAARAAMVQSTPGKGSSTGRDRQPALESEPAVEGDGESAGESSSRVAWMTDYGEALAEAEREGKMLFVYFHGRPGDPRCARFETKTLGDPAVCKRLQAYVCVRLPLDSGIRFKGRPTVLLGHDSFREMLGSPGVVIVDFANRDARHYGCVVSTFPMAGKLRYTAEWMAVILDLPPGTLTQRTLIYAVRIHPDRPASTSGRLDAYLVKEAESHSRYQARIRLQGHHHWEKRFHRINAELPRGLMACEVCAESWPGENLVEAAIECVRCWRYSSGHWSAVRAMHPVYGYDMKRGPNGIWYATGVFGRG